MSDRQPLCRSPNLEQRDGESLEQSLEVSASVMCSKQITSTWPERDCCNLRLMCRILLRRNGVPRRCCLLFHSAELLPPALAVLREDADVLRGFCRVLPRRLIRRGRVLHHSILPCRGLTAAK